MVTARSPRISHEGFSPPPGFHPDDGMIGRTASEQSSRMM
jgi:hypothetical protein